MTNNEVIFLMRGRGTVLVYEGYQYYKNRSYINGAQLWKCSLNKKNKCTGSITMKVI